jgi:hypothetical protein
LSHLVLTGRSDELTLADITPGDALRESLGIRGRWPMVRNGGTRLWMCVTDVSQRGATSRVGVYELDGRGTATPAFQAEFPGGIAPRVPAYVNPSPAGDRAAVVAPGDNGLRLELVIRTGHLEGAGGGEWERRDCGPGGPIFPVWSPGGRQLAVHRGIVLELLNDDGELQDRLEGAAAFRTPAWAPNGERLAFATVRDESAVQLRVAPIERLGASPTLAEFPAPLVLAWRPQSEWICAAVAADAAATSFSRIVAVHSQTGEQRNLYRGPFVGFWWSPDGSRMVLMTPTQSGDGAFRLMAVSPDGLVLGVSDAFVPSDDTRLAAAFFDQYSVSHGPWLPGSSKFIVSGRLYGDARPASFGDVAQNRVFLWEAQHGAPLEDAGPGDFATPVQ